MPASRTLLWELPFWFALLYGSLVPATIVTRREWFGIPMKYSDLFTLLSALYYGGAMVALRLTGRRIVTPWVLLGATLSLLAFGAISLGFGPLENEDRLAMGFTLVLAASGPLQAAGLLSAYDSEEIQSFLNRLVGFLALLCLLYTAESVFNIGLRSEEGRNLGADFGIQRVRGPLFGPSTGYLPLLPAIGWSLRAFLAKTQKKPQLLLSTLALLAALLGLGSRAALILLGVYIVILVLMMNELKKKIWTGSVLAVVTLGAALLIYGQADTQRLQSFEDNHRRTTHETAWAILETEGPAGFLTGRGYGSIWSWYRRDALRGEWIAVGDNTILTGYGISLYHCHSTLLELAVEFGFAGVLWLLWLCAGILRLPWRSRDTGWRCFTWAIAVSLISFGFDLFLFKEVRVNCIWWIFVFAAFTLARFPREQRSRLA
jgi:hypothetical protein